MEPWAILLKYWIAVIMVRHPDPFLATDVASPAGLSYKRPIFSELS